MSEGSASAEAGMARSKTCSGEGVGGPRWVGGL